MASRAMPRPITAATNVSTKPSTKSCITIRPRLAPSAVRIAISQPRVAVRAKTRVPTLAHITASSATKMKLAIESTRMTTSDSPAAIGSAKPVTRGTTFSWVFGWSTARRW